MSEYRAECTALHDETLSAGTAELIARAQAGDEAAVEAVMQQNMGLVRKAALRFRDRGAEMEDLLQIGAIGMLRAVRSCDLTRGFAFSTYAVPLIIGEIRRFLRDDGLIHVSRTTKKLGMDLMGARAAIAAEEGREPRLEELARRCGVSIMEAAEALDAITPVSSLSAPTGEEDGPTLESTLADSDNGIDRLFDRIALSQAVAALPPLWRKIVLLRYFRDCTQQRTAELLGLTQVKVSREEKKIIEYLRQELGDS